MSPTIPPYRPRSARRQASATVRVAVDSTTGRSLVAADLVPGTHAELVDHGDDAQHARRSDVLCGRCGHRIGDSPFAVTDTRRWIHRDGCPR